MGSLTPPMSDSQLDTLSDKLNYQARVKIW